MRSLLLLSGWIVAMVLFYFLYCIYRSFLLIIIISINRDKIISERSEQPYDEVYGNRD